MQPGSVARPSYVEPRLIPVLEQKHVAGNRASGRYPLSPAHFVGRSVRNFIQAVSRHERIHVMELVGVEVEADARQPRWQAERSRKGLLSQGSIWFDHAAWLSPIGTCVCWLRRSTCSAI